MPNCYLHRDRPGNPRAWDPSTGWDDTIRWTVPIDDEHHMDVTLELANLPEEHAEAYRQQRREFLENTPQTPVMDLLKDVLEGRMTPAELARYDLQAQAAASWTASPGGVRAPSRTAPRTISADPTLLRSCIARSSSARSAPSLRANPSSDGNGRWTCTPRSRTRASSSSSKLGTLPAAGGRRGSTAEKCFAELP